MVRQAQFMPTEQTSFQALAIAQKEEPLDTAIHRAKEALLAQQQSDGHWVYELEADCTIPAEYVLMMHYMDEIDEALQTKIACFLRVRQNSQGGWSLYPGGETDISCSVKVYYALKLAGDCVDERHMAKARRAILAAGGAAKSNVFTRITLALFQQLPWRATPFMPVEAVLLPRWFPFHLSKVSYWSRTVMVPLLILCSLKAKAANPRGVDVRELFVTVPELEKNYFERPKNALGWLFLGFDYAARRLEWLIPRALRGAAIRRATYWFTERLNGENGLGGIFPAMVSAHEALALLGFPDHHSYRRQTKAALEKMLVVDRDSAYCQPCRSPMWDTGLACLSLREVDRGIPCPAVLKGLDWLKERQLSDEPGDWREYSPGLEGGGWPFEYVNDYYPDLDDTSLIGWAMEVVDPVRYRDSIAAAAAWINGMQSKNGGFASFDRDNSYYYLNHIPFADHGALLDPPTEDVTARCVALLSLADKTRYRRTLEAAIGYLVNTQQANGSWHGRWGTNYIYGTWSVLSALEIAGEDPREGYIQRAVEWLKKRQNSDGGWGESNDSYFPDRRDQAHPSTAYSTAWAMLALMAAGEVESRAVEGGANYLLMRQQSGGQWYDESFTAPGFPRVFYLKYHGYTKYFPLWALAQYRNRRR